MNNKNIKDKDVIDGKLIECKDVTDSKCNQEISEEDAFEIYYEVKSLIEKPTRFDIFPDPCAIL